MTAEAWTHGEGLVLRAPRPAEMEDASLQRALRDGIERGYDGTLPALPEGVERYVVEAGGQVVAVLGFRREVPRAGAITLDVLAVAPGERGHAYGTRALLAAEERLERDGMVEAYARVPRTNGRGLYFMLRCGYAPVPPPPGAAGEDVTWFRRNPALGPAAAPPRAAAGELETARGQAGRGQPGGSRPSRRPRSR